MGLKAGQVIIIRADDRRPEIEISVTPIRSKKLEKVSSRFRIPYCLP
jgi:hypothetical protein